MTDEESAPKPRRRSRATSGGQRTSSGSRRRRVAGAELVDTLNEMVGQLITENRKLKRELARLASGAVEAADGTLERTLRSLHRKVRRAVSAASTSTSRRRRSSTASATPRRRTTTRRRTTPASE